MNRVQKVLIITFLSFGFLNSIFPPREWVSGKKDPGRGFLFSHINKSHVTKSHGQISSWSKCRIDLPQLIAYNSVIIFGGIIILAICTPMKDEE